VSRWPRQAVIDGCGDVTRTDFTNAAMLAGEAGETRAVLLALRRHRQRHLLPAVPAALRDQRRPARMPPVLISTTTT